MGTVRLLHYFFVDPLPLRLQIRTTTQFLRLVGVATSNYNKVSLFLLNDWVVYESATHVRLQNDKTTSTQFSSRLSEHSSNGCVKCFSFFTPIFKCLLL